MLPVAECQENMILVYTQVTREKQSKIKQSPYTDISVTLSGIELSQYGAVGKVMD